MSNPHAPRISLIASALLLTLTSAAPVGRLEITLLGLRSTRGMVRMCLTPNEARFPNCNSDPVAFSRSIRTADGLRTSFARLPLGTYALTVFHDENGNGKLDTFAGIPREGFGFSRNPTIMFGAPRFKQVAFSFTGAATITLRMKYLL